MNLPEYGPDPNPDEAIGNLCPGTREAVQERDNSFFAGLANRK